MTIDDNLHRELVPSLEHRQIGFVYCCIKTSFDTVNDELRDKLRLKYVCVSRNIPNVCPQYVSLLKPPLGRVSLLKPPRMKDSCLKPSPREGFTFETKPGGLPF